MSKEEKLARLQTKTGRIVIAALDHRGSLQQIVGRAIEMRKWKREMVQLVKQEASAVLIDPVYGREIVASEPQVTWLMSLEKSGYRGRQEARVTELLENWGVREAKEAGATAVKLLLYYDPDNDQLAAQQRELARHVAQECQREKMPFLLEPLSYQGEEGREARVLRMAREVSEIEADIWKMEYPGSKKGCRELTRILGKPWVLLSAGRRYEQFRQALQEAVEGGASGMAVGRAVWQEMEEYEGEARWQWLEKVVPQRMRELREVIEG